MAPPIHRLRPADTSAPPPAVVSTIRMLRALGVLAAEWPTWPVVSWPGRGCVCDQIETRFGEAQTCDRRGGWSIWATSAFRASCGKPSRSSLCDGAELDARLPRSVPYWRPEA